MSYKYGTVFESIENPGTFATAQYSTWGVSFHYWHYDKEYGKVMAKTLGTDWKDALTFWKPTVLPAWGKIDQHGCVSYDHDHCPVCGSKLHRDTHYMEGGLLCEEYVKCTENDCYLYEFAYGSYAEFVDRKEWQWSYSASEEERTKISSEVNAEIIRLRENFKERGVFYDAEA